MFLFGALIPLISHVTIYIAQYYSMLESQAVT